MKENCSLCFVVPEGALSLYSHCTAKANGSCFPL